MIETESVCVCPYVTFCIYVCKNYSVKPTVNKEPIPLMSGSLYSHVCIHCAMDCLMFVYIVPLY